MENLIMEYLNKIRENNGFRSIDEIMELAAHNTIYDVFSVLIAKNVIIGSNNVIYPNVVIDCKSTGEITLGDDNILFNGCTLKANGENIKIGNHNEIGENIAFVHATANEIRIGNGCRLMNHAQILDGCMIGDGCQVLGNIKVIDCILKSGETYAWSNPNMRGGVLKGYGFANHLSVNAGEVIFGKGTFTQQMIERQEKYHPNWNK